MPVAQITEDPQISIKGGLTARGVALVVHLVVRTVGEVHSALKVAVEIGEGAAPTARKVLPSARCQSVAKAWSTSTLEAIHPAVGITLAGDEKYPPSDAAHARIGVSAP